MSELAMAPPAPPVRLPAPLQLALRRIAGLAIAIAIALILLQGAITIFAIPPYLMPGAPPILGALAGNAAAIARAAGYTVGCTLAGLALSVTVAVASAALFIAVRPARQALMPLLMLLRTVPLIALAPILITMLGRGAGNSIVIVAFLTYFQLMLAAEKGLRSVTRSHLELMRVCGAGFWQVLWKLRLPSALPFIFTGLRIAASSAILCAMFAEFLSGAPGLGEQIIDAFSTQDFPRMWALVIVSTVLAYLFLTATMVAERVISPEAA